MLRDELSTPHVELELTRHAVYVMSQRRIRMEWVERTVVEPALRIPDPHDSALERLYLSIPERGGRVLRVVVNTCVAPRRVISVFFDRGMRGKL